MGELDERCKHVQAEFDEYAKQSEEDTTITHDIDHLLSEINTEAPEQCLPEKTDESSGGFESKSIPGELYDLLSKLTGGRRLATVPYADAEIRAAVGSHQGTDHTTLISMSAVFLFFMFLFRRWA